MASFLLMSDDAMDLEPLRLNSISVVSLFQIVGVVLGDTSLVAWSAKAASILQSRRLIQIKLPPE